MAVGSERPRSTCSPAGSQQDCSSGGDCRTASQATSTCPGTLFARSHSREAAFTESPITVYSNRDSSPMFPATASPVPTPIPASISETSAASRPAMLRAACIY